MENYNSLVTKVIEVLEDDSPEFAAYIPTAIKLAEERLFRNLDIDFSTTIDNLTLLLNTQTLNKPEGHRVTHNIYYTDDLNNRVRLIKKTEDFLYDYWPNIAVTAPPKYYADRDNGTWLFAPVVDRNYTLRVECEVQPQPLSVGNQTNIYTDLCPDLLFFCTLSEMCDWMMDDARKALWETKIAEAFSTMNNEGRRFRQDDNTNVNNINGGRNTKIKGRP